MITRAQREEVCVHAQDTRLVLTRAIAVRFQNEFELEEQQKHE